MKAMSIKLRENAETFTKLKGMCPDNKIPQGLVLASAEEINDTLAYFQKAKEMDLDNESMPSM
jgi:serine/threonine-protein phosphatase 2B catalytic subunit